MAVWLLVFVTVCYAGYNLFIKQAGSLVPETATSTILATLMLQFGAIATSSLFASWQYWRTEQTFALTHSVYLWALLAGVCIGAAEIGYMYLFNANLPGGAMSASQAVPVVVTGTIVITLIVAGLVFGESLSWLQWLGAGLIVAGVGCLFIKV